VDDLVTKGIDEPYRMFTSRAESRLELRIDNADERLTPVAARVGLATEDRQHLLARKLEQKARLAAAIDRSRSPNYHLWLKQPEHRMEGMTEWIRSVLGDVPVRGLLTTLETEIKYAGYIGQQQRMLTRLKESERRSIPGTFQYSGIPGLSREVREKLQRVKPDTLAQASRIPGVTPAAIAVLDVYLSLSRGD